MLNAPSSFAASNAAETPARILLVEDDAAIATMLAESLRGSRFSVEAARSGAEMDQGAAARRGRSDPARRAAARRGRPQRSAARLRASTAIPIIMVTALGQEVDRIIGLEIGADDYVAKPFNTRELVARIRALLRRARPPARGGVRAYRFAGWRLYPAERQLASAEGVRVTTTSAEFDLLLAFCQNPGRILSRDQLLDLTHGGLAGPIERSVDVHVSRIRQKIEPDPRDPTLIKTVRLGGYVFTPEVDAL